MDNYRDFQVSLSSEVPYLTLASLIVCIRKLESVAQLATDVEIVISHSEVDEWTGDEC
jgi:hypothetical protein